MEKILILANNDVGLYKFRKELINELLKQSEVFIALPEGIYINELIGLGCKFIKTDVDRRGVNPINDLRLIYNYNQIVKALKPDLIITYTIKPNIYGGLISRIRKIDYAVNITGLGTAFQNSDFLRFITATLYRISLKKAKVVFFENEDNKNVFINSRIISDTQAYKLNGAGVNLEEYQLKPYPVEKSEVRFLFIGRVMKEKGIDEFIEAAQIIKLDYENVQFDIVGPQEEKYTDQLTSLQNSGIINYYGYQKDVRPFIEKAHCFVLPSYHEGMANTLLECGAMGRPLITSDIPGCKEAIVNERSGFLVKKENTKDLIEKLKLFISLSNEEKEMMGLRSRDHIVRQFEKHIIVKQTLNKLR